MNRNSLLKLSAIFSLILTVAMALIFQPRQLNAQEPEAKLSTTIGTAFTYQGRLADGGNPANGVYDFQFELYDAETNGVQVGSPVAGPGLWARWITIGLSSIPARLRPSAIRAKPPPEVVTIARAPAYQAPIAIFIAAISSSACSAIIPKSFAWPARNARTPVDGDMG